MLTGAWIAEGIGWVATYLGILCMIWHISIPALIAFVSASAFILLVLPVLSTIGLGVYAVREYKKQGGKHQETNQAAPGDAPGQVQGTTRQAPANS
jgi:hypothetical protein